MTTPPVAFPDQRVIGEPFRLRHEIAWTLELVDGRRAVLAQLVPELAADAALRRRWVADMERIAALPTAHLAPTLSIGPSPDPRDPAAAPPWRVRLDPPGTTLDQLLRRAPLPIDEVIELGGKLAAALQTFHAAGAVLRDLDPRSIVIGDDGKLWFTDVGHARLAILSSRTASSLLLESSPYVAAEALLGTVVDARADVYSLGVVLWRALTGRVPFEASLLGSRTALPDLATVRPEIPSPLAALVGRCLAHEAEHRPPTARDVADALAGRGTEVALVIVRANCQACGAQMRAGLRLCLACGKQAVQFHRAEPGDPDAVSIVLEKATEDAAFVGALYDFYEAVAIEVPKLNFVIGDERMYGKTELADRHKTPAVLIANLAPETGKALALRLRAGGFKIHTRTPKQDAESRRFIRRMLIASGVTVAGGIAGIAAGGVALGVGSFAILGAVIASLISWGMHRTANRAAKRVPLALLRATPAALPAGDALVATIATVLATAKSPDVRARLDELASLVQRLCDAKAALAGASTAEIADAERVTAPVKPLVELARSTAEAIEAIDHQLTTLDEGTMMRALARCEARKEAPELKQDLLAGLDTLRQVEEQRANLMRRLLELTSLTRSAVALGLDLVATLRSDDVEVAHALAALED